MKFNKDVTVTNSNKLYYEIEKNKFYFINDLVYLAKDIILKNSFELNSNLWIIFLNIENNKINFKIAYDYDSKTKKYSNIIYEYKSDLFISEAKNDLYKYYLGIEQDENDIYFVLYLPSEY